ncbi:MAG: hypothetical protein AAGI91_00780 [Bacteroidota bacterium]
MRTAALLLLPVLLAACRPVEGTQEPPESVQESPAEAAVVPDDVVGTYRLVAVNEEALPGGVGAVDECEVQLSRGTITLRADARYELDVLARAVCDPDEPEDAQMVDRATSEGPFTVEGSDIRFNSAVTEIIEDEENEMGEDEMLDDEEPEEPDLFDASLFAGTGSVSTSTLTILVDGLTTLTFERE